MYRMLLHKSRREIRKKWNVTDRQTDRITNKTRKWQNLLPGTSNKSGLFHVPATELQYQAGVQLLEVPVAHLLPYTHTQTNHGAPAAHRDEKCSTKRNGRFDKMRFALIFWNLPTTYAICGVEGSLRGRHPLRSSCTLKIGKMKARLEVRRYVVV